MKAPSGPIVDQIMSQGVVHVDVGDTIGKARAEMERADLRKILLVKDGQPLGMVEDWLVSKLEQRLGSDATIAKAFTDYKVEPAPVKTILSGTDVERVKDELASNAAVVVVDLDRKLRGIVTVSDLDKIWQRI